VLEIKAKRTEIQVGESLQVGVTIRNEGKEAVTLVEPGDGSAEGWRTPIIGWSVVEVKMAADKAKHPGKPIPVNHRRCGNINALKAKEIIKLKSGATQALGGGGWVGAPGFAKPGVYRVVFYYQNESGAKWTGIPLGKHDPDAMKEVQNSCKCLLASNELTITVKKAE
jgi:hypothetical protein